MSGVFSNSPKRLGDYLSLYPADLDDALAEQRRLAAAGVTKRLGDILLELGKVSAEELRRAVQNQRLDRLRSCYIFTDTPTMELERITELVDEISVPAGERFIDQDAVGDYFYILADGRASVFRVGDYGEDVPLAQIEPGETAGEMGYFSHGHRTASVRAVEICQLLRIKYDDLEKVFDIAPAATRNFLSMVTRRLRRINLRFQDVTERSRVTERSLESLRRFLDLSEIAAISQGIEGLIQRVVITASKVMDADRATLFLMDSFSGELWSKVAEGMESKEIRIPLGRGVAGWVAQHDELVNIPDAYEDSRFDKTVDEETGYRTRSILCGPIKNLGGETVGVIQVINKRTGPFCQPDEELFRAFAYQTAISVENFRLYRRLVTGHQKMAILLDVATSVAETLDLDALIIKIVSKISQVLGAERSTLFMVDEEQKELWSKVALGEGLAEIRFPLNLGLAGHVVATGKGLNIRDAYQDPRFNPSVDRQTGYQTRNVLSQPVLSRDGRVIGVTQAINKHDGYFDEEDEELLKALTSQVAVALENAQLYRHTVNMKNYLVSIQESITNAIISLDKNYHVVTANSAALELFKCTQADLQGRHFLDLLGDDNPDLKYLVEWVQRQQRSLVDYDVDLIIGSNDRHSVNLNFVPLIDEAGKHRGLVLVFDDITQEKRIKGTLTRYMAKDIVDRILEDPDRQALGGLRNKATIMFTDIRGFTGISDNMTAEETVVFLNDYFSQMVEVIFANRGVLDKYIGDGLMAVFGVPYIQPDDARRAVMTALEMRSVLAAINASRKDLEQPPLRIGMGISTGEVVSGNIGSERRMDFTVIGDSVNVAARLENLNKLYGTDILISEPVMAELGDGFTTRLVDQVLFKGRKKPVKVYQVLAFGDAQLSQAETCFATGLELYLRKEFKKAAELFGQGQCGDPVCKVFLQRCRHFLDNPPPPQWDGVWISD